MRQRASSTILDANVLGFVSQIWGAAGGHSSQLPSLQVTGSGNLPSIFAVTDLAVAAVGAAGLAVAELLQVAGVAAGDLLPVEVDRRLASFWFGTTIRAQGWQIPPSWDAVAGDYQTADGWIRLHTNAPHHRAAALAVLDAEPDASLVAQAVRGWQADQLELAIVEQGGCAAAMRTLNQWHSHPQGMAVNAEPLLHVKPSAAVAAPDWRLSLERPLQGIRVLDLTRVLAGPTATRLMAGLGAEVLRLDPPTWNEPALVADMVVGKRCARIDLKTAAGRDILSTLLAQADVLVHGYRSDALAGLGFDQAQRRRINPGLVDVSLDAYGWSGAWHARRGFDSLVQMSSGIAHAGMQRLGRDRPTPLPVQALDHATGYLLALAAIRGLTQRLLSGQGISARTSLARMAQLLVSGPAQQFEASLAPESAADCAAPIEPTYWGPAQRLRGPLRVGTAELAWQIPAGPLGSAPPQW